MQGYAYILTHPGIPCVLWEHAFDWGLGDELKQLIEIRKRNDIRRDSKVEIVAAYDDLCAPFPPLPSLPHTSDATSSASRICEDLEMQHFTRTLLELLTFTQLFQCLHTRGCAPCLK